MTETSETCPKCRTCGMDIEATAQCVDCEMGDIQNRELELAAKDEQIKTLQAIVDRLVDAYTLWDEFRLRQKKALKEEDAPTVLYELRGQVDYARRELVKVAREAAEAAMKETPCDS